MVRRADELRRRRTSRKTASRSPSFQTRLQRLKTHADAVHLLDQTTDAQTDHKVLAFARLATLAPKADLEAARQMQRDARLSKSVASLAPHVLSPLQRCTLLWSFGMLFGPDVAAPPAVRHAASRLADAMNSTASSEAVASWTAATAVWGCASLDLASPLEKIEMPKFEMPAEMPKFEAPAMPDMPKLPSLPELPESAPDAPAAPAPAPEAPPPSSGSVLDDLGLTSLPGAR